MKTKKKIRDLFAKIQELNPALSDFLTLQKVLSIEPLRRTERETAFLELVDPIEYAKDEMDDVIKSLIDCGDKGVKN